MSPKKVFDLPTVVERHFDAFGVASPQVIRACYPGYSVRSYYNAYRDAVRRPLAHFPTLTGLGSPSFRASKQFPLDESMQGMGDALALNLWSGEGDPLIGDSLDTFLLGEGVPEADLPSRGGRYFLGTGAIMGSKGRLFVPMYLGAGRRSDDQFVADVADRWVETWHTVLALPRVQSVVVLGHGLMGYDAGSKRLRELSRMVHQGGLTARLGGGYSRPFNRLKWNFAMLQFAKPPVGAILAAYYRFQTLGDGVLRHISEGEGAPPISRKGDRRWLYTPEAITV